MPTKIRSYIKKEDKEACYRIWQDVGWLKKGQEKVMDIFLQGCDKWVPRPGKSRLV